MSEKRIDVKLTSSGGERVQQDLKATGDAGDRAFRALRESAKSVPPHLALVDDSVKSLKSSAVDALHELGPLGAAIKALGTGGIVAGVGIAGAGFLAEQAVHAAHYADTLLEAANALGVNVEKLQAYRYAAKLGGLEQEQLDSGLASLTKRLGDTQGGYGKLQAKLQEVDPLLLRQLQTAANTDQAFKLITDRAAGYATQQQRVAVLAAAFGDDAGVKLAGILNEDARAFAKGEEEARRLGIVVKEGLILNGAQAKDELDKLGQVVKGNLTTALLALAPTIKSISAELAQFGGQASLIIERLILPDEAKSLPVLLEKYQRLRQEEAALLTGFDPLGRRAVQAKQISEELDRLQELINKRQEEQRQTKQQTTNLDNLAEARKREEASLKAGLKLQEDAARSTGGKYQQIQTDLGLDIASLAGLPGEKQEPFVRAAIQKAQNAIDKIVEEEFKKADADKDRLRKESEANTERAFQASLDGEVARLKRSVEIRSAELKKLVQSGQLPEDVARNEELALREQLDKALNDQIKKGDKEREEQILKASKELQALARKESEETALALADPLQRKLLEVDQRFDNLKRQILDLKAVAGPAGRELADALLTNLPDDQAKQKQKIIEEDARESAAKLLKDQEAAVRDFTDRIQAPILSAATNIQNRLADAIENVFAGDHSRGLVQGFADDMVSTFRRAISEITALALARPIIVPVVQVTGDLLGQPGIADKVATQFGGLPGGSSLLSNLLPSGSGGLLASLNALGTKLGFANAPAAGIGPTLPGVLGNLTLAQTVGAGGAGLFLGNQTAALLRTGRAGATLGGGIGGVAGFTVGGPFGAIGGSVLGGLYGAGVQSGLTNRSDLVKGLTAGALASGIGIPFAPFIGPIAGLFQSAPSEKVAVTTSPIGSPGPYPTGPFGVVAAAPGTQNFPNERFIPSISQPLVAIDQLIAAKLTEAQKATVTSALQSSTQGIINVGGNNTLFALVQQRLDVILSSLLGPEVQEKLTANIQKTDDHIEEFVQKVLGALDFMRDFPDAIKALSEGSLDFVGELKKAAQEDVAQAITVIQQFKHTTADLNLPLEQANQASQDYVKILLGLKEAKAPLSDTEQALAALEARFEAITPLLQEVGLSADDAARGLAASKAALTSGFDEAIRQQILGITDPLQLALDNWETTSRQRLKDAQTIGANIVEVERLNALEREKIVEQQTKSARDYLLELTGSTSSVLPNDQVLANAEAEFARLRESVLGGNRSEADDLVSAARNLLDVSREQFASSEAFFQREQFVESTLRNILGESGGLTGGLSSLSNVAPKLDELGSEAVTQSSLLRTLTQQMDELIQVNARLRNDLARYLAA